MNYQYKGPIKSWSLEERPREKLSKRGISALTDVELIAILLRSGNRETSAIGLAQVLLEEVGGLEKLAKASLQVLVQIKGIGDAKAMSLIAAFELSRRKTAFFPEKVKISSSLIAARYLMAKLGDFSQEVFYVLFLNRNNEVEAEKQLFVGGVAATIIDPKVVFREAILHLASGLIIAHNHPSGNLVPSQADIQITKKIQQGADYFDIRLLDHVIVSDRSYYSFADEGKLYSN
ncbi:MAG: DNA repair protein RadC [Bacteroidia bacterium]|nr:DNA repair protein RadC [Bacteroidia bacterium]